MDPQDPLGPRAALSRLQSHHALPALRHLALRPRGLARFPGRRRRSVHLAALQVRAERPPAGRQTGRRLVRRLDHHAVDAAGQRRAGGESGRNLRPGRGDGRSGCRAGRDGRGARAGRSRRRQPQRGRSLLRARPGRNPLPEPFRRRSGARRDGGSERAPIG